VRVYDLALIRLGQPSAEVAASVAERFEKHFPTSDTRLNRELSMLLVYLQSPAATGKTLALLTSATAPEEQIHYGMVLRQAKTGWTPESRTGYFKWLQQSPLIKGGHSLAGFLKKIQHDALANVDEKDRAPLVALLAEPLPKNAPTAAPRPLVKEWKQDEILRLAESGLNGRNFEQGRAMFGATQCANCHRFQEAGSIGGPDLSVVANRFNVRDLVDSILEPSKVVSDQYQASTFVMADGKQFTGRVVNLAGENIMIVPNLLAPDEQISIKQKDIEEVIPSKLSLMPTGLLNTLHEDELLDLLAYLLSRGDREHAVFKK
jgi:putative heme-binding domain-containing protein